MNLIINPTGISIILNNIRNNEELTCKFREIKKKNVNDPEVINFQKIIQKEIENRNLSLNLLSAETNSLLQMKNENMINLEEDKLVLLFSDTTEGKIAANLLYNFFQNNNRLCFTHTNEPELMKHIKMGDAYNFVRYGLISVLRKLENIIEDENNDNLNKIIINVTSGFKGIIPIFTIFNEIISQRYHKECWLCYLFEGSTDIISFVIDGRNIRAITEKTSQSITTDDYFVSK